MKLQYTQKGYTLTELLIAATVLSASAIAGMQIYQGQIQDEVDLKAVAYADNVVASYKRFRTVYRRNPNNIAELMGSPYYTGSSTLPWGTNISGAANANDKAFVFSFPADSPTQAQRIADYLKKYDAQASGSLVSFQTSMPTQEVIANQMLCREAIPGAPDCNVLEVDIDVNDNDLTQVKDLDAVEGEFENLIVNQMVTPNLEVEKQIELGTNIISYTGNTIEITAGRTGIGGELHVNGNIEGNNSNISNVGTLNAKSVDVDDATIDEGTIDELSGISLNYESAELTDLVSDSIQSEQADFKNTTTEELIAQDVKTESFTGDNGRFTNATIDEASGETLTLSNRLTTASLSSQESSLGVATATSFTVTDNVSADSFNAVTASFNNIVSSGNVSGRNFTGVNFSTSVSSVNANYSLIAKNLENIDENTQSIKKNSVDIEGNTEDIALNAASISTNAEAIAQNTAANLANKQANDKNAEDAADNASAIAGNRTKISKNEDDISDLDSAVTNLEKMWKACETKGGCQ